MAKPTKQHVLTDGFARPYERRKRSDLLERRVALRNANQAIKRVINVDYEYGNIDEDTAHILREVLFQVLMAVDSQNTTWHIRDAGHTYPRSKGNNDWFIWNLDMMSPITRLLPLETEYETEL